jgi:hypothetical protein
MIVSELIALLRNQDPDKAVGIRWGDDAEIVAWVEDLVLMQGTAETNKFIGFGNRHGIIFLSTVEDGEYSRPVGELLQSLSECNATATVAMMNTDEISEETVGYIVGGFDLDDDVFVLTAKQEEFIQRR